MNEQKIPIGFWSIALIAAVLVLLVSVAAGRLVGTELLRHGMAPVAQPPTLSGPLPPEVVGGQLHAVAVPGQSAPIWTKPPKTESSNPAPPVVSQPVAPIAEPAATSVPVNPKPPVHAKIMTSMIPPKRSLPVVRVVVQRLANAVASASVATATPTSKTATARPTLVPIAQITPAGDNLGF